MQFAVLHMTALTIGIRPGNTFAYALECISPSARTVRTGTD